jgi:mannobiose 2-epimerase
MNTHLHVIEAYAKLYTVLPSEALKQSVTQLLVIFEQHIIDPITFQQKLFFQNDWTSTDSEVSFGHDIEAAWLLQEAAVITKDALRIEKFTNIAQAMASEVAANLSPEGAVYNDYDIHTKVLNKGLDWWPQAEAMVGFLNAFEISGSTIYLQHSLTSWAVINKQFKDARFGEWYWGYDASGNLLNKEKAGFWKCPYHNSRACIEVANRISHLLQ